MPFFVRDNHVSRDDMTSSIKEMFLARLFENAEAAVKKGVILFVHRGVESSDARHADQLMSRLSSRCPLESERLQIIVHPDCDHHQVATHLKQKELLLETISNCISFPIRL